MRKLFCTLLTLSMFALAINVFADIAKPKPSTSPAKEKPSLYSYLQIVPDAKAVEARLQIPQATLDRLLQTGAVTAPANPTFAERIAQSRPRTIIAGVFLFMSISVGGLFLIRSGQKSRKIAAALVLVAAIVSAATIITQANAGPPGYVRWQNLPQALTDGRSTTGGVTVEIVAEDKGIKLIVPLRNPNKPNAEE